MRVLRSALCLAAVSAAVACGANVNDGASSEDDATKSAFPRDFQFGTAIAGFQVDMGCPTMSAAQCEDRQSDWYQWITTPRITWNPILFMSGQAPSKGPGFYELYNQDLDRASKELGSNALRLSIEWSRIFPEATWGVTGYDDLKKIASPEGIAYYHAIFKGMKARGLTPFVTVNHYTLPLWVHDGNACNQSLDDCIAAGKAGWADPNRAKIVDEIAKYAGFVAKEFGGEVDQWATLNEPFSAVVLPGYLIDTPMRSSPPGLSAFWARLDGAKTATTAMIEAHAAMYDAIKANDPKAEVGIVYSFSDIYANSNSADDQRAAEHAQYVFHDMFMDGVAEGKVDQDWTGNQVTRPELAHKIDFVGLNYYFRFKAKSGGFLGTVTSSIVSPMMDFDATSGFEANPKGLQATIHRVAQRYKLPIYVSETGADQGPDENAGAAWMVQTLAQTKAAIAAGDDVRGYFAWSLTDNYEWNHGMNMKFGMYGVDVDSKARRLRPAGDALGQMLKARDVPPALEQQYASFYK